METKIFFATFSAIFFAELADKTQLVGIGMAAKTARPFAVWLGSVCAYILVTAISILIGTALSKYIRPDFIKYAGGFLFIVIGALIFLGKI